jgi:hypothetical protein
MSVHIHGDVIIESVYLGYESSESDTSSESSSESDDEIQYLADQMEQQCNDDEAANPQMEDGDSVEEENEDCESPKGGCMMH